MSDVKVLEFDVKVLEFDVLYQDSDGEVLTWSGYLAGGVSFAGFAEMVSHKGIVLEPRHHQKGGK